MDVDSDSSSSSSSSSNCEEIDKFKQDKLKCKIDILENKVNNSLCIMSSVKFVTYDFILL